MNLARTVVLFSAICLVVGCESGPLRERITRGQSPAERLRLQRVPPTPKPTVQPVSAREFTTPKAVKQTESADPVLTLYQTVKQAAARVTVIQSKATKSESLPGQPTRTEHLIYQYRREPFSLHLKVIDGENAGREVMYVAGQHGGKVHLLPSPKETPFGLKPIKMALDPDAPLLKTKCPHDFRDAGIDMPARLLGTALASNAAKMKVKYIEKQKRPEFKFQVEGVAIKMMPGEEPLLPKGGSKEAYFVGDAASPNAGLPIMLRILDGEGHEIEKLIFEDLNLFAPITDRDFDPKNMK
jgi:hypothetical protein